MRASAWRTYAPTVEHGTGPFIRIRSSTRRLADWAEAAATQALSLRSTSSTTDPPADRGSTLTVELQQGTSPVPPSAKTLATDERGNLLRTSAGWRWVCSGYDLVVSADAKRATIEFHESSFSTRGFRVTAYALRHTLTVLLPRTQRYPLHAAGLCLPESRRAVILAGPSGCGKSTLTAGLLDRGWQCLSDDLLVLTPPTDPFPRGRTYGLTQHVRLWPDAWKRLGLSSENAQEGTYGTSEKRSFALSSRSGSGSGFLGKPHWVLFPEIDDRSQSRLVPIDPSEALRRGFEQMPPPASLPDSVAAAQFETIAAVVRESQCLRLQAGRDLHDDPGQFADLLSTHANNLFSDAQLATSVT